MSVIYSWVKNIIIFLVLTTIISNLLGKSNYKKYINLITGIILVLIVISPLMKLFQLEDMFDYFYSHNSFSTEASDIEGELIIQEKGQMTEILKEYKAEIKKQVSDLLEDKNIYLISTTITVDEEEESDNFGNLIALDIIASYINQDANDKSKKIDKISIDDIKIGDKEEKKTEKVEGYLTPDEINVKNLLSDFYNMNPDNINISIQEQ